MARVLARLVHVLLAGSRQGMWSPVRGAHEPEELHPRVPFGVRSLDSSWYWQINNN